MKCKQNKVEQQIYSMVIPQEKQTEKIKFSNFKSNKERDLKKGR